jgi:uncharacterized membrane protein YeaQ/YmgE (transglycosylase-associated protein family)
VSCDSEIRAALDIELMRISESGDWLNGRTAMDPQFGILSMPGTGFFGMLVIGFLAGWIAERTMNRDHGILTNILVGIAGSFVGGTLASLLGIAFYGFLGNLVVAIVGAILILWLFGRARPSTPQV